MAQRSIAILPLHGPCLHRVDPCWTLRWTDRVIRRHEVASLAVLPDDHPLWNASSSHHRATPLPKASCCSPKILPRTVVGYPFAKARSDVSRWSIPMGKSADVEG